MSGIDLRLERERRGSLAATVVVVRRRRWRSCGLSMHVSGGSARSMH
jgi:hypothetical protein